MDIHAIAEQIMGVVQEAPEKLQELLADPAGAIEQITGHQLDEAQISQVVDAVTQKIGEGGFDLGSIADQVGGLLGGDSPLGGIGDMLGGFFKK